ncbi:uncharacterized protein LOC112692199 [Sipha flava]|uniref:Uncharacterized protein LOC112692199 n=1 Tax=Sipha flava TaxID=143950 RepID=A0A8B8GHU7_9HEMI|nr:uncharacterized protein LOC112692199 [Sipha flava]
MEILFSAIRSSECFINNPTASQFEATLKKLLVHSELSISKNANCAPQDTTNILHAVSSKEILGQNFLNILCMEEKESFTDEPEQNNKPEEINDYKEHIIEHIAGFVVKQLHEIIDCSICFSVLEDQFRKHTFIDIKNRGGLKKPSFDVIKICKITEKYLSQEFIKYQAIRESN